MCEKKNVLHTRGGGGEVGVEKGWKIGKEETNGEWVCRGMV